jgi:quercetin dioxygenase-like cupin family protein
MRLIRAADRNNDLSPVQGGRFDLPPMQKTVLETDMPTRVSFIRFEPGAHTMWHSHAGGQVLHFVDGRARVCAWGEKAHALNAGDTLIAPPGEKHWHGAAADVAMTQIAISSGEVTWLEDVEV